MKNKNKAQASVEFLSTYGWVMIVLLLVLGIIANYGLLNPSKYLPDKADFGEQLKSEEYFLDYDSEGDGTDIPVIAIKFRNNFARAINISKMRVKREGGSFASCNITSKDIAVGDSAIFSCLNITVNRNIKNKIFVEIVFQRNSSISTPKHTISGLIFTEPISGDYCHLEFESVLIKTIDNNNIVCT